MGVVMGQEPTCGTLLVGIALALILIAMRVVLIHSTRGFARVIGKQVDLLCFIALKCVFLAQSPTLSPLWLGNIWELNSHNVRLLENKRLKLKF